MRTRVSACVLALLAALLVAACGGGGGGSKASSGGGGSVPGGSDYAPSSAPGFVSVATDTQGGQWKAADDLLKKFPGRAKLIATLEKGLAKQKLDFEQDIKPALGPETDVGILKLKGNTGNAVIAAKPADESKFLALLGKLAKSDPKKPVTRKIGDWTLASDTQGALTAAAAAHNGSSLQDNALFKEAMGDLPGDALLRVWVDGAALSGVAKGRTGGTTSLPGFGKLVSLAVALQAKKDGAFFQAVVKTDRDVTVSQYSSKLAKQVPAGVYAYLSFNGLDKGIEALASIPAVKAQAAKIQQQLGVSLQEIAPIFAGEGALYVRQGIPLPEVTLVLTETDEATSLSVADKVMRHLAPAFGGRIISTTVAGVPVKQVKTPNVSFYYGTFGGKLVISDATTSITGLKDSGDKLANDSVFKDAKDTAGMPDSTAGFLYVNLKDSIPILENLVTSSGATIPPEVQQNLDPLQSMLFYSTVEGPKATVAGFVGIQ